MAVIPSLMSGVPFVGLTTTAGQLGAITGTVVAVPMGRRHSGDVNIGVQMTFGAAPGASVFKLMISIDGVNFVDSGLTISDVATFVKAQVVASQVRLDQTSKTNGVTATGTLLMG